MRRFLDDGNYVISIFVNLTKAFDTVDQYKVINGTQSALNAVTCGVPQGSVLGPVDFCTVYDIYEAVAVHCVRLFADDTALYMWHKNLTTLVEEIKSKFSHLYMWCVSNKLIINRDKTNFVLFHTVNYPNRIYEDRQGSLFQVPGSDTRRNIYVE